MNTTTERLDARTRRKAAEAGLWQTSKGDMVRIREMADSHVVNALLRELLAERPDAAIARALAAEINRRHIREYAMAVAADRMAQ